MFSDPKSEAVWSCNSCRATHGCKLDEEGPDWMRPTTEDRNTGIGKNLYGLNGRTGGWCQRQSVWCKQGGSWETKYPTTFARSWPSQFLSSCECAILGFVHQNQIHEKALVKHWFTTILDTTINGRVGNKETSWWSRGSGAGEWRRQTVSF